MRSPRPASWIILLWGLWTACGHVPPVLPEHEEAVQTGSSWARVREDPRCVVPLCEEGRCALWRCGDLVEVESDPPVVLARGPVGLRPPLVGTPGRWWGISLVAPTTAQPVFEIPWHHWNTRGRFARRRHSLACMLPPEPLEKHHLFPQESSLASWFSIKGIDIHAYTVSLPPERPSATAQRRAQGGQWNEAWRTFQRQNRDAGPADMWRFAFALMWRFNINGPYTPYYCQD